MPQDNAAHVEVDTEAVVADPVEAEVAPAEVALEEAVDQLQPHSPSRNSLLEFKACFFKAAAPHGSASMLYLQLQKIKSMLSLLFVNAVLQ